MSGTLPKEEIHGLAHVMRAFSELNVMAPIDSQRPYVQQAISAARMALAIYKTKPSHSPAILASFEREFQRAEILAERFDRGEVSLSSVVYPARKLAYQIDAKNDEADEAAAVT